MLVTRQTGPFRPKVTTTITTPVYNGLFSRTTWVSRYQKGRTVLDFTEARDDGMAVAAAGPYVNHLHFTSDRWIDRWITTRSIVDYASENEL